MDLQVELLGEYLVTVGAIELSQAPMDHLFVFVKVAFLREFHITYITLVWPLPGMGAQMVEVLAHREYREVTRLAIQRVFMLALKQLELPGLTL